VRGRPIAEVTGDTVGGDPGKPCPDLRLNADVLASSIVIETRDVDPRSCSVDEGTIVVDGTSVGALREDEIAAASSGISLIPTKLLAFAIVASVSGLAGAFFRAMLGVVTPETFQFAVSFTVLSTFFLGGIGNIAGVAVGAGGGGTCDAIACGDAIVNGLSSGSNGICDATVNADAAGPVA